MEKMSETLSRNEFMFYYDEIFHSHSQTCRSPGKSFHSKRACSEAVRDRSAWVAFFRESEKNAYPFFRDLGPQKLNYHLFIERGGVKTFYPLQTHNDLIIKF